MPDPEEAIRHCYSTWGQSYYEDYYSDKAAYPPVHQDIIRNELKRNGTKTLLEAGCGPASILRDLTELEMDLFGFDLTPEMVQECKKVMSGLGYDPDQFWEGSVTQPEDFRGPTSAPAEFDASICIGVLPHIPSDQDNRVFANLTRDDLVDRRASGAHARTAIRTPGQPSRRTGSVTIAAWRPNIPSNQNVFLEWLEVLHPLVQFQKLAIAPNLLRLPAALRHAVGEIKITDTQLRPLGGHCQRRQRLHRFKPRQGHGCSHCTKHGSS